MAKIDKERLAGPTRPPGAPDIPQFHLPPVPGGPSTGVYSPRLYGAARIHFTDGRRKLDETKRVAFLLPLDPTSKTVDWDQSTPTPAMPDDLLANPPHPASYLPLPSAAMDVKPFTRWARAFDRWLARTQRLVVPSKTEGTEDASLRPKRGGVSVELVGIVWELS